MPLCKLQFATQGALRGSFFHGQLTDAEKACRVVGGKNLSPMGPAEFENLVRPLRLVTLDDGTVTYGFAWAAANFASLTGPFEEKFQGADRVDAAEVIEWLRGNVKTL